MFLVGFFSGVLAFIAMVIAVFRQPGYVTGGLVLLSIAAICAVLMARGYALRVQDRIIRLEMQTRLARLGRDAGFAKLAMPQIIALRFASDAELPALMERAMAENLSSDQIKQAVSNWQADLLRT
jgi:hypothetical protein